MKIGRVASRSFGKCGEVSILQTGKKYNLSFCEMSFQ